MDPISLDAAVKTLLVVGRDIWGESSTEQAIEAQRRYVSRQQES